MSRFSRPASPRPPRIHMLFAALVSLALCVGGAVVLAQPASAAGLGPGWDFDRNSHLGAYTVPGGNAYCINPGFPPALSATTDAGLVSAFTSFGPTAGANVVQLGPATLARINYLVTTRGQTGDRNIAAAVALAVASTANPAAHAAHTAPWGDDYYVRYMPKADFAWVKALAAQFRAEAAAFTPAAAGSATMSLTAGADNGTGALTLTALTPATTTATITLTNGTFASTGTAAFSGTVSAGMSLPIRAAAPSGAQHFRVSAHAEFAGAGSLAGVIRLWATPGRQYLATPGGATPGGFVADAQDAADRSALFAPVASTQVASHTLARGERSVDAVTFATTSFVDPVSTATVRNPWPEGVTVTATGTWYGPSASPLTPSATPPAGVPIAGRATVTGGAGTHSATADVTATKGGYYTWVWAIDAASQTSAARVLLPPAYRFTDGFGVASESQLVPARPEFGTRLSSSVVTVCGSVTDRVTPANDERLRDSDGTLVPVTLTGRVYRSTSQPVRARVAPADAELVQTLSHVITDAAPFTSPPIAVGCEPGWITVQWSVEPGAQPEQLRGLVATWSDDYGVPAETARIAPRSPRLATTGAAADGLPWLIALAGAGVVTGGALVLRRRVRG